MKASFTEFAPLPPKKTQLIEPSEQISSLESNPTGLLHNVGHDT